MNGLVTAARYLTIVPLSGQGTAGGDALGRAAVWFPVVGLAIGGILVAVDRLSSVFFTPLLAALLVVTAWKLVTGGLHLDGLADCLDGLMGADPQQRLAIMRDSRIGAFGAIGLVLFLLLEIAAVAELPDAFRWRVLLIAPAAARAAPIVLAAMLRPARPDGQGAAFCAGLRRAAVPVVVGAALLGCLAVLQSVGVIALAAGLLTALLFGILLARRLAGITGDVLGAAVETTELAMLLTVVAWISTVL